MTPWGEELGGTVLGKHPRAPSFYNPLSQKQQDLRSACRGRAQGFEFQASDTLSQQMKKTNPEETECKTDCVGLPSRNSLCEPGRSRALSASVSQMLRLKACVTAAGHRSPLPGWQFCGDGRSEICQGDKLKAVNAHVSGSQPYQRCDQFVMLW